jgi:thiamine-phosphate pyrophosphorylase
MDRRETVPPSPARLILFTTATGEIGRLASLLVTCCRSADIAAVILRDGKTSSERILSSARGLIPAVQETGAAFLLENNAGLVAKSGADGSHLTSPEALQAALPSLKPGRIAGAAGLFTRHDAMTAGEQGSDYVMFGDPGETRMTPETIAGRIGWWSEIFEVPCVAPASDPDEAAMLASVGADFIALGDAVWDAPGGPVEALRKITAAMRTGPVR